MAQQVPALVFRPGVSLGRVGGQDTCVQAITLTGPAETGIVISCTEKSLWAAMTNLIPPRCS